MLSFAASDPVQASAAAAAAAASPARRLVFEPHVDPDVLAAQLLVLSLTVGAAAYWWLVVVPSARASLAKDKRRGEVRQYLGELQSDPSRKAERWFYTDWLDQLRRRQSLNAWGGSATAEAPRDAASPPTGTAVSPRDDALPPVGKAVSPPSPPSDAASRPAINAASSSGSTATSTTSQDGGGAEGTVGGNGGTARPVAQQGQAPRLQQQLQQQEQTGDRWEDLLRPAGSTPTPAFWNLDNPLVAVGALLAVMTVMATLLGR